MFEKQKNFYRFFVLLTIFWNSKETNLKDYESGKENPESNFETFVRIWSDTLEKVRSWLQCMCDNVYIDTSKTNKNELKIFWFQVLKYFMNLRSTNSYWNVLYVKFDSDQKDIFKIKFYTFCLDKYYYNWL